MVSAAPIESDLPWARGLRVALVHDWLTGFRGGEKVLEVMGELFPQADLFTLVFVPGSTHPTIERRRVRASWMNRLPGIARYYRYMLPFFPTWIDGLDLSAYDLVVSSSHCVAKGARVRPDAVHVCYCHTPMRYVWDRFEDYFGHMRGLKRWMVTRQAKRLRAWDASTSDRVDRFVANSHFVEDRIRRFYTVDANRVEVVFPPVDLEAFPAPPSASSRDETYFLVSALVPYKLVHVAVEACAKSGRRLAVAGSGPERTRLEALIGKWGVGDRIELLGRVDDNELRQRLVRHRAFLFPNVEDFGITPLEAMASGMPVIAFGEGGALDTVVDGVTGMLYPRAGVDGLVEALDRFEARQEPWDEAALRQHATRFSRDRFKHELAASLEEAVERGPVRESRRP